MAGPLCLAFCMLLSAHGATPALTLPPPVWLLHGSQKPRFGGSCFRSSLPVGFHDIAVLPVSQVGMLLADVPARHRLEAEQPLHVPHPHEAQQAAAELVDVASEELAALESGVPLQRWLARGLAVATALALSALGICKRDVLARHVFPHLWSALLLAAIFVFTAAHVALLTSLGPNCQPTSNLRMDVAEDLQPRGGDQPTDDSKPRSTAAEDAEDDNPGKSQSFVDSPVLEADGSPAGRSSASLEEEELPEVALEFIKEVNLADSWLSDQVRELEKEAFGHDTVKLGKDEKLAVLLLGGELVVGYAIYAVRRHLASMNINKLAIASGHRSCGFGRRLLRHLMAIARCRSRGQAQLEVVCLSSLPAAVGFYKALKFQEVQVQASLNDDNVDGQVYMEYRLHRSKGKRHLG